MKQIPILSGRCLVVEMDKFTDFDCPMEIHGNKLVSSQSNGLVINTTKLPPGNWRVIGMFSEVREEQAAGLVEYTGLGNGVDRWLNYVNNGDKFTALESLHSSIEAGGWYFENPHGDEPKPENTPNYAYSVDVRIWEAAQSRVLDRSRCLLLGRDGV